MKMSSLGAVASLVIQSGVLFLTEYSVFFDDFGLEEREREEDFFCAMGGWWNYVDVCLC
jgi:hypothetical protein